MLISDWAGPRRVDDRRGEDFVLLDRHAERAAIDRVLDAVRGGFSGTLVLHGGPGVGKSTLLEYAVAAASDLRVSGIAGVESEISMEFGGLHQLLVPCLAQLDDLPSLEAIFLSTFVMIGQNRQASFQQAKADHDFTEQELELKTNTQLTREIHQLTTELHRRLIDHRTPQET
jgi:Protein of unknown function (DUF1003)